MLARGRVPLPQADTLNPPEPQKPKNEKRNVTAPPMTMTSLATEMCCFIGGQGLQPPPAIGNRAARGATGTIDSMTGPTPAAAPGLAVLASGSGTILEAILERGLRPAVVIADRPCRALEVAAAPASPPRWSSAPRSAPPSTAPPTPRRSCGC